MLSCRQFSAAGAPTARLATRRLEVRPVTSCGLAGGRGCIASAVRRPLGPHRAPLLTVAASQPDTEEARSPADAPQEWEAPQPSRRPDIFPEFEKMERVFLPKPLPGDPEMPDEEAEEAAKRTEPGDPDPEAPAGEPSEPEPQPGEDPAGPERKDPSIPQAPE